MCLVAGKAVLSGMAPFSLGSRGYCSTGESIALCTSSNFILWIGEDVENRCRWRHFQDSSQKRAHNTITFLPGVWMNCSNMVILQQTYEQVMNQQKASCLTRTRRSSIHVHTKIALYFLTQWSVSNSNLHRDKAFSNLLVCHHRKCEPNSRAHSASEYSFRQRRIFLNSTSSLLPLGS